MRRSLPLALAALLLLTAPGCQGRSALVPRPTSPSPKLTPHGADPGPVVAASSMPGTPVAALPTPGGGPISDQRGSVASLIGKVKAPASLISDKGGGVVGNNGAALIGNNSGSVVSNNGSTLTGAYRLLATDPDQAPVAGVTVRLLDAAGQPVLGADQKALTAITGADGNYAITGAPTDRHVFAAVDLPGGHGQLTALVARGDGQRTADLDLISTLTTGYIYAQYVAWQPDPRAVIEKLPAEVEASTRALALTAFSGGGVPVPPALNREQVVTSVQALRRLDTAFDDEMEAVRRLLIPAGLSNFGSGRLATQIGLKGIETLGVSPDGRLYVATGDRLLWRLAPDGTMTTVAGNGSNAVVTAGQLATQAGIGETTRFTFDAIGRVLIANRDQALRIGLDGLIETFQTSSNVVLGAVVAGQGDGLVAVEAPLDLPTRSVTLASASPPQLLQAFTATEASALGTVRRYGRDALGRIVFRTGTETDRNWPRVVRYDPGTKTVTELVRAPARDGRDYTVDAEGHVFVIDFTGNSLGQLLADGTTRTLVAHFGDGLKGNVRHAVLFADDTGYLAANVGLDGYIYRFKAGSDLLTLVAGTASGQAGGTSEDLVLNDPAGVVPLPDGALLVSDSSAQRILRIDATGHITLFAGTGEVASTGDGTAATKAAINNVRYVVRDVAGTVYLLEGVDKIRAITPDGVIRTVFTAGPDDGNIWHLALGPDGTLYAATLDGRAYRVDTVAHSITRVYNGEAQVGSNLLTGFACDPQGRLWSVIDTNLVRLTGEGAPIVVKTHNDLQSMYGLTFDARGRAYVATGELSNKVVRFDPANGQLTTIAGVGGLIFTGTGTDDGVKGPSFPAFATNGDLYVSDTKNKQLKRIPAALLD